jgi:seryl-tRNA synthetase
MLDLRLLKENPQIIKDMLEKRKLNFPINDLIALDKRRRELIAEMQQTKHKKNLITDRIAFNKKNNDDSTEELQEMKVIASEILRLEEEKKNS